MTTEHIEKLFQRVIRIENQFAVIDFKEVEGSDADGNIEENGGDLVLLNADVTDENDVMTGFHEYDDFE